MKKRIVSFLLALVMAVSLLPVSAFAVEDTASPDVPAVVEPEAQTAGEQQDERAGKQTETSAFAAEDAPFVLKVDGQAVAVEKTPITGLDNYGTITSMPIYKATIYETASRIAFDVADKQVPYVDNFGGDPFSVSEKIEVATLVDCAMIGNEDITFLLEGGASITDVIDTTAKKTPFFYFNNGDEIFYGLILEIKEDPAPAEDESEFPYKGTPVVTYTKAGDANESTAALKRIGTRTWEVTFQQNSITKGKTWLVSLPAGATINDVNFGETVNQKKLLLYCVFDSNGTERYIKRVGNSTLAAVLKEAQTAGNYIVNEKFDLTLLGVDLDKPNTSPVKTTTLFEGKSIPTSGVKGFIVVYYEKEVANEAVIIQIENTVDTAPLQAAIDAAPKAEDGKYYTSGDRYNGKAADTILNDKNVGWDGSFWKEYQKVLAGAQRALTNAGSQAKLDEAAAALQAAIAKLIPTDRVNATALYETLNTKWCWQGEDHTLSTAGDPVSADNCTFLSWQPYAKALKDAQALLDTLYENGTPTDDNTAAKQGEVDKLAAAADVHMLVNKEAYAAAYDKYMAAKPEAEALLQQYDPAKLTESDYTAASWTAYTDAHAVLKTDMAYRIVGGTTEDWKMLQGFNGYYAYNDAGEWTHYTAHIEALKNAYRQLTSATDVTVSFTYLNNFSALYPGFGGTSLYANSSLPLAAGSANLLGAYNAANIELDTHDDTSLPGYYYANTGDTNPRFLVFINGSCAGLYIWSSRNSTLYPQHALSAVQLHNGDSVKMVRVAMPQFNKEDSSGLDSSKWNLLNASEEHYQSSVALIDMTAPGSAKVGDKAKFSATVTGANTTNLGSGKSAAGITLFISDPSETEALSQPIHKTAAATGADGSLQYVFTKPGWYTVAMFNVTPDDYTRVDIYGSTTIGEYYSLYGGDYALIHVTEADDLAALLKLYRAEKAAEAKAYFDGFHDYDFTAEGYAALKDQYETLTANLQKATDLTALMETYDADFARLKELGKAAIDHAAVIAGLRQNLSYLPDDLNDLNANYKTLVKDIQTVYGGLNSYQKKLLSANETKRLGAVAKIDADSLTALAVVKLAMGANNDNNFPYNKDNSQGAARFGYETLKWKQTPNPDGTLPSMSGNWWKFSSGLPATAMAGDHVFLRYYLNTTDEQYWPVWSVDGGNTWNLTEPLTLTSVHGVDWSGYYLAEYVIPSDVADGSTVTFDVKMVSKTEYQAMTADSEETVAAARTAALSRLKTLYNSLGDKAKAAYDEGVKNINAASSAAAIDRLYQAAAVAMREAVNNYGKVRVIVENTTFTEDMWPNGKKFWDGVAVDDEVALTADSTMMSCIVAALKENGYTQVGADSNYISSITVGDQPLGQFDGGQQSGWMGTLNDWFTNEGFAAFTVANGKLADGDVIRVMYTREGLGADLGGTWGNSDTTIKALEIQGGKLASAFTPGEAGGLYEYTLTIEGESADLRLTPTASNKNFLTKIFLNEKVTGNTEGFSFYKRTESIPVKAGDTIYVGCGARAWPTMNNQAGNTQESDGTWYVLRVVNANAGADYVTELISQLPEAAAVTYASYQKIAGAAAAARSALDALSKDEQAKVDASKLKKLEDAIKGFRAIDDVRAQIDALPDADRLTTAEREAAKSAQKAYNALTAEQRDYLTGAQLEKITAIAAALTAMDAKHSSGSGSAYTGGHTFTTDLEPGSITGVFVDGKKLDSRYYTVSGSDVTLTADYLKTLRSGKHTVKIENATKVATGSFTLSGSGAVQSSRTGDPGVAIYFAVGAVSFLGSAAWLRKRKET